MNILVANSCFNILEKIEQALAQANRKALVTVVTTVVELVAEIKSQRHDILFTEYTFDSIDVWKIAKLIHSDQMADYAIPIYAVADSFLFDVPVTLAKAHRLILVDLQNLIGAVDNYRTHGRHSLTVGQPKNSILIIEDDRNAAALLQSFLSADYIVDTVDNGEDGIKHWLIKRHDLILLDYILPDIYGDEVLKRIMDIDRLQPVIIMSGYDGHDQDTDLIIKGAYDYLRKPVSFSGVLAKCRSVLSLALMNYHSHHTETKINTLSNFVLAIEESILRGNKDLALAYIERLKKILPQPIYQG